MKHLNTTRYLAIGLFFITSIHAQPNPYQMVPPTPEAASLGKFIEAPVNSHHGVPDISIPLHQVSDGTLSLPISLRYHASGIRVGEVASWVGTGWTLSAGGMISRATNGLPDDEPGGYLQVAGQISSSDATFMEDVKNGLKDSEPDIFTFSLPGYGGKFFFDWTGNIHIVPKQDLRIEYNENALPINTFTIITPNGTRYFFGYYDDNGLVLDG